LKLLFDENLSPRLVVLLADVYRDSVHVHQCGLGGADDSAIWEYAKINGFSIVSKDSDFQERTILIGSPPKVIGFVQTIVRARMWQMSCGLLLLISDVLLTMIMKLA